MYFPQFSDDHVVRVANLIPPIFLAFGDRSMPTLPSPLWAGMVARDRVLSMGQRELDCLLMLEMEIYNHVIKDS